MARRWALSTVDTTARQSALEMAIGSERGMAPWMAGGSGQPSASSAQSSALGSVRMMETASDGAMAPALAEGLVPELEILSALQTDLVLRSPKSAAPMGLRLLAHSSELESARTMALEWDSATVRTSGSRKVHMKATDLAGDWAPAMGPWSAPRWGRGLAVGLVLDSEADSAAVLGRMWASCWAQKWARKMATPSAGSTAGSMGEELDLSWAPRSKS